jgi:UTP-glucose-1-phosphate uridylyltransferase
VACEQGGAQGFPIGKLPVIAHVVAEMIDAGLNQVVVVSAAHNSGFMKDLFDPSKPPPLKIARDPVTL